MSQEIKFPYIREDNLDAILYSYNILGNTIKGITGTLKKGIHDNIIAETKSGKLELDHTLHILLSLTRKNLT